MSTDRVALLTGAAGDIGRAVALRMAAEGVSLVLADRSEAADALEETRLLCVPRCAPGAAVRAEVFDVADGRSVRAALRSVVDDVGAPELIFNNAGYQGEFANLLDADLDDARRVFDVNVIGVLEVLQAAARELRDAGASGSIVNTASMAGVGGAPNMAAYSASKGAVISLTRAAAKDLAPFGIRVNAVSPGFIGSGRMWNTQVARQAAVPSIYFSDDPSVVAEEMIAQVPMRRAGTTAEVAAAVAFLLSDEASYLTGQNIEIAGGGT